MEALAAIIVTIINGKISRENGLCWQLLNHTRKVARIVMKENWKKEKKKHTQSFGHSPCGIISDSNMEAETVITIIVTSENTCPKGA